MGVKARLQPAHSFEIKGAPAVRIALLQYRRKAEEREFSLTTRAPLTSPIKLLKIGEKEAVICSRQNSLLLFSRRDLLEDDFFDRAGCQTPEVVLDNHGFALLEAK